MNITALGFSPFINNLNSVQGTAAAAAPAQVQAQQQAQTPQAAQDNVSFSGEQTQAFDKNSIMQAAGLGISQEAQSQDVQQSAAAGEAKDATPMTNKEIANYCNGIAASDLPIEERRDLITEKLAEGVARAESPDPTWEKATPQQLSLYVHETLEHIDALREIGSLRGMNFEHHDTEEGCGKFEPEVAQFLALPGRTDSVKWAIAEHNNAGHHDIWKNPNASKEDLAESASDIVNAWRMERRVYSKAPWSWERVEGFINEQFNSNELSAAQRDALYEAIPFQMEYEAGKA